MYPTFHLANVQLESIRAGELKDINAALVRGRPTHSRQGVMHFQLTIKPFEKSLLHYAYRMNTGDCSFASNPQDWYFIL